MRHYFYSDSTVLSIRLPALHDPVIMYTNNQCCLLLSAVERKFHLSLGLYLGSSKNERSLFHHVVCFSIYSKCKALQRDKTVMTRSSERHINTYKGAVREYTVNPKLPKKKSLLPQGGHLNFLTFDRIV